MRARLLVIGVGFVAAAALLIAFAFTNMRGDRLPDGLITSGATALKVSGTSWRSTSAAYQAPSSYAQVSDQLRQQMAARGWTVLKATRSLSPSIFNPDPAPLLFQRFYWLGWMRETARVTCTIGPPARVEVVVTRTIRWPPLLRRLF